MKDLRLPDMHLAKFIVDNMERILVEWEKFALTLEPAAKTMDSLALRDHAHAILEAVAKDMTSAQSVDEQSRKSWGQAPILSGLETAAATHGALRHIVGFDLRQLVAEYRALRASVLRLWAEAVQDKHPLAFAEMTRFNEAIDQALAESVERYSVEIANSRDTFLAILGQDLKAPLGKIDEAARTLSALGAPAALSADRIRAGAATLGVVVSDLLEYTRARLGRGIPLELTPQDLETVCKASINEVQAAFSQQSFRLETGGDLKGVFDGARMRQVLVNLLNNAVQQGGRGKPVEIVASGNRGTLKLVVRIHGSPIPGDELQVIFNPLVPFTAQSSANQRPTRLALGLYIAREIVLAHGGKILAESSQSAGTVFTVQIPSGERRDRPVPKAAGA